MKVGIVGFAGSGKAVPDAVNCKLFFPSIDVNVPVALRTTG